VNHYILDERGQPKLEPDIFAWAEWFELDERRIVRSQQWDNASGNHIHVSTVFLGIDHNFEDHGLPLLWETMAWVNDDSGEHQMRYTSIREAIIGHNWLVEHLGGRVLE
jgi:hypothetical protein